MAISPSTQAWWAITVYEFSISQDIMHLTNLDMEDAPPFFFLDQQGESTFGPVVREGRKTLAGESMHELVLNSVARDEVVNGFTSPAAF